MPEGGSAHVDTGDLMAELRERDRVEARATRRVEDPSGGLREEPAEPAQLPGNHRAPPARPVVRLVEMLAQETARVLGASPVQLGAGIEGHRP